MKLITYKAIRPGFQALGSYTTRAGTNSAYSHTELVFEPGDRVDSLMPDLSTYPLGGSVWCASASALDVVPAWSPKRAGRTGGVRFKRINLNTDHWLVQDLPKEVFSPIEAAKWFIAHQGLGYDWRHIAGFLGPIPTLVFCHNEDQWTCTEAVAASLGFKEPERFHPGNLPPVVERFIQVSSPPTKEVWAW